MVKKVLLLLILILSIILVSCTNNDINFSDFHYVKHMEINLNSDNTFTFNGFKYHQYELTNYGYLLYDKNEDDDFVLRLVNGDWYAYVYHYVDIANYNAFFYYIDKCVYEEYNIYSKLCIKEDLDYPINNALITKIEFKINKDQYQEFNYSLKAFDDIFLIKDNVKYKWDEETVDGNIYVGAYIGYAYITFYNDAYRSYFEIVTPVYQDNDSNYYIHLITKDDQGIEESNWYLINY